MFQILETAVCRAGCEEGLEKTFAKYQFFDLGSGYGKFPMFAALVGMKAATGIELDTARSHVGETLLPVFDKKMGCSKLAYFHESFTKPDSPWTVGTGPRVLFLDAVGFGKQMPTISKMMAQAAFCP